MPHTINKTYEVQIIGGIFSTRENDHKTIKALQDLDIPQQNIQVVVRIESSQTEEFYADAVVKAIRNGNILVAVNNVKNQASIVELSNP